MLPGGIEPTTSPLPRECSTTELRQRSVECGRTHATGGGASQPLSLDVVPGGRRIPPMRSKKDAAEARKQRLAKALKANIARRKGPAKAKPPPPGRAKD